MKTLTELSFKELQNLTSNERWVLLGKCILSCARNNKSNTLQRIYNDDAKTLERS